MWQRKPITETQYNKQVDSLKKRVLAESKSKGLSDNVSLKIRDSIFLKMLLPYQVKWILDESPFKVIEKSRQVGLSWADAGWSVIEAARKNGKKIWYAAQSKDVARQYIEDVAYWAKILCVYAEDEGEILIEDAEGDITGFRAKFASGNTITALSSAPTEWRSKRGHAKIDESGHLKSLKETMKAAKALRIWGGTISVIGTHNGVESEFNELINDIRAGVFPYSLHRITFSEAVEQGLYRKVCEKENIVWSAEKENDWVRTVRAEYGPDAAEELDVIPAQGGGTPFPRAIVEQCMDALLPVVCLQRAKEFSMLSPLAREVDIDDWCNDQLGSILGALNKNRRSFIGVDFARSGALSIFWLFQECDSPPPRVIAPMIVELANIPHEQQRQVLWYIADRVPRLSHLAMDAGGNGSYLAEVTAQRYGAKVSQIMLSESWYRDNMPRYQAAYQDRQLSIPFSMDIIDDHRALKIINGVIKLPKSTGQKGRHGDSAIVGALAWYASRQSGGGPIEYKSIGKSRFKRNFTRNR